MIRKIMVFSVLLLGFFIVKGQSNLSLGGGYFGKTIFHPGLVLEAEMSNYESEKRVTFPLRFNTGFFHHKRRHDAYFADLSINTRIKITKNLFGGIGGGLGLMAVWYNSDLGVFEVSNDGTIEQVRNYGGIDFTPHVNFELGYSVKQGDVEKGRIWIRPKAFWQYPSNERFQFNYGVGLGYSFNL